jgi:hypothetical protein
LSHSFGLRMLIPESFSSFDFLYCFCSNLLCCLHNP